VTPGLPEGCNTATHGHFDDICASLTTNEDAELDRGNTQNTFDVVVIGAGPAGLIAGHACAEVGLRTAVVGPLADAGDGRTAALLEGSVNLLKRLHVWKAVEAASEPLKAIRLVDAMDTLLRAPEVMFKASEIGLPAFGYNVPNAALTAALEASSRLNFTRVIDSKATITDLAGQRAGVTTSTGHILEAHLIVAADGRDSPTRTAAGIPATSWSYTQSAVVTTFTHTRPHDGVSTELHRRPGPLTVVPGPGQTSSLVWVETHDEAKRLAALDDEGFTHELASHIGGLLGTLTNFAPRRTYPLSGRTASSLGKHRVALVGEAAHVMPPIGAQGLNLGFRDAACIAEIAGEALSAGEDIGSEALLERYDRARRTDVAFRVFAVDLLNRSLLSSIPGAKLARGLGLLALANNRTLRARIMREGVAPSAASPALMRPMPATGEIVPSRS
jgi:2-octaprenyl-6-methoxyphenol hydroxylase